MILSPSHLLDEFSGAAVQNIPILAAGLIPLFFMTATHSTIAAPELSMQLSIVCPRLVLGSPYRAFPADLELYHAAGCRLPACLPSSCSGM